ncbi:hypothetical protein CDIK_1742 [Cucumispora dikerogammari]|nr:hypothetical protein CDIK_1742 [Cucumispora dikerogammari]
MLKLANSSCFVINNNAFCSNSPPNILVQPLLYMPVCQKPEEVDAIIEPNTSMEWSIEYNTLALEFCIEYYMEKFSDIKYDNNCEHLKNTDITLVQYCKKRSLDEKYDETSHRPKVIPLPLKDDSGCNFILRFKPFGYSFFGGTKHKCSHVISFGLSEAFKINSSSDLKYAIKLFKQSMGIECKTSSISYAFVFILTYMSLGKKHDHKEIFSTVYLVLRLMKSGV